MTRKKTKNAFAAFKVAFQDQKTHEPKKERNEKDSKTSKCVFFSFFHIRFFFPLCLNH